MRAQLAYYEERAESLKETVNYATKVCKNVEQFLINKKETAMEMLKLAIENLSTIVPDADVNGIQLLVKDKTARVVNETGQDIVAREGSALCSVLGILMRYTLLKVQPDCVHMLVLDEACSNLSDATAGELREYINTFKDDTLIIGIEQRNYLYEGIDRTVYEVVKGEDKISRLRKVGDM